MAFRLTSESQATQSISGMALHANTASRVKMFFDGAATSGTHTSYLCAYYCELPDVNTHEHTIWETYNSDSSDQTGTCFSLKLERVAGNWILRVNIGGSNNLISWTLPYNPVGKWSMFSVCHISRTSGIQDYICVAAYDFSTSTQYSTSVASFVNNGNEQQRITITGSPTGGTFTVTLNGNTTPTPINHNDSAATVQTRLEAITGVGAGQVLCTGGPLPGTPVVVEFRGTLAQTNVSLMTATSSLTGGTAPAVAISVARNSCVPTSAAIGNFRTLENTSITTRNAIGICIPAIRIDAVWDGTSPADSIPTIALSTLVADGILGHISYGPFTNCSWAANYPASGYGGTAATDARAGAILTTTNMKGRDVNYIGGALGGLHEAGLGVAVVGTIYSVDPFAQTGRAYPVPTDQTVGGDFNLVGGLSLAASGVKGPYAKALSDWCSDGTSGVGQVRVALFGNSRAVYSSQYPMRLSDGTFVSGRTFMSNLVDMGLVGQSELFNNGRIVGMDCPPPTCNWSGPDALEGQYGFDCSGTVLRCKDASGTVVGPRHILMNMVDFTLGNRLGLTSRTAHSVPSGGATGSNKRYTLTVSGSAGTFTMWANDISGSPTTAIAYNASAATVQSALEAVPAIGTGNIVVTGTIPGTMTIEILDTIGFPDATLHTTGIGGCTSSVAITSNPNNYRGAGSIVRLLPGCTYRVMVREETSLPVTDPLRIRIGYFNHPESSQIASIHKVIAGSQNGVAITQTALPSPSPLGRSVDSPVVPNPVDILSVIQPVLTNQTTHSIYGGFTADNSDGSLDGLEVGDLIQIYYSDDVSESSSTKLCTNATSSTSPVITCTGHGLSAGDVIYFYGNGGTGTLLTGFRRVSSVADANTFTLAPIGTGATSVTTSVYFKKNPLNEVVIASSVEDAPGEKIISYNWTTRRNIKVGDKISFVKSPYIRLHEVDFAANEATSGQWRGIEIKASDSAGETGLLLWMTGYLNPNRAGVVLMPLGRSGCGAWIQTNRWPMEEDPSGLSLTDRIYEILSPNLVIVTTADQGNSNGIAKQSFVDLVTNLESSWPSAEVVLYSTGPENLGLTTTSKVDVGDKYDYARAMQVAAEELGVPHTAFLFSRYISSFARITTGDDTTEGPTHPSGVLDMTFLVTQLAGLDTLIPANNIGSTTRITIGLSI